MSGAKTLYREDVLAWSKEQARALRLASRGGSNQPGLGEEEKARVSIRAKTPNQHCRLPSEGSMTEIWVEGERGDAVGREWVRGARRPSADGAGGRRPPSSDLVPAAARRSHS